MKVWVDFVKGCEKVCEGLLFLIESLLNVY